MAKAFVGLVGVVLAVIAAVLVGRYSLRTDEKAGVVPALVKSHKLVDGYNVEAPVDRVAYAPTVAFARRIMAGRKPVIITGSPLSSSRALNWTVDRLRTRADLINLDLVYRSKQKFFTGISHEKVFAGIPKRNPYDSIEQVPFQEFLRTMNNPNEFLYFSGPLASAIAPELRKDLEPIPLLWGGQNLPQTDEIEPPLQAFGDLDDGGHLLPMSMWMGQPNIVTTCHYDEEHNFFVQLVGPKRFILFPPSQWENLYLYPAAHAHKAQSQVPVPLPASSPSIATFPRFEEAVGQEAMLQPGDVLYIPPYWFHQVTAFDFSISIATRTTSREQALYGKIKQVPLALDEKWALQERVPVVRAYIIAICTALPFAQRDGDVITYIRRLITESRYAQAILPATTAVSACSPQASVVDPALITRSVQPFKALFAQLPANGVADILLANFLEGLAFWAVKGDLELLAPFFTSCFQRPS